MSATLVVRRILGPTLLAVLVSSACGTRVHQANAGTEGGASSTAHRETASISGSDGARASSATDPAARIPEGLTAGKATTTTRIAGSAPSTPRPGTAAGRTQSGGGGSASGSVAAHSTPADDPTPAPSPAGAPGKASDSPEQPAAPALPQRSRMTVGVVGTLSGPVGAAYAAGPPTLLAWRRLVNERGGLNGHPVDVIFGDDGGDPARHRSLLQDFVENRKVIAFVGNPAPLTGTAGRAYLEEKRVPVIGGDLASAAWHESPVFFPQGTTLPEMLVATIATGAKFTTKKKLGIATCAEAQACRDAYDRWPEVARRFGLDLVYRAQVSLAQPDFTAECLGARNAGVELFATVVDVTGVSRFSTSCGRQGFKPTYLFIQTVVDDREKNDPNLQGAYGAVATFPWPADDSPAVAEYHTTMRRFAPNVTPAASSTQLWAAAKIFERAASTLAEPPERARLLDILYGLQNETFGGLTQPITYNRNAAASRVPCWFVQTISNGAWVAPQGSRPVCP